MVEKKILAIKPTKMTATVMQKLESMGLIIRLSPHNHDIDPKGNETVDKLIYQSSKASGAHKLISVTVNRDNFSRFGYHPDNEEFLLIANPICKPLYLAVCYLTIEAFNKKVADQTLTSDDFIMLECVYNDPEASFFVMLKDVLHGEAIWHKDGLYPSFYVTEGSDNALITPNWKNYELAVDINE